MVVKCIPKGGGGSYGVVGTVNGHIMALVNDKIKLLY